MATLVADNLFHFLSYEGTVDLEKIDDPIKRAGLEVQIHEFGQVPQQIFEEPHPTQFPHEKNVGAASFSSMRIDLGALFYRLTTIASSIESDISLEHEKTIAATGLASESQQLLQLKDFPYPLPAIYNCKETPKIGSLKETIDESASMESCNMRSRRGSSANYFQRSCKTCN